MVRVRAYENFWTDERRARALELWQSGQSAGEIAKVLGCSRAAVIGVVHRAGLKRQDVTVVRALQNMEARIKAVPKAEADREPKPRPVKARAPVSAKPRERVLEMVGASAPKAFGQAGPAFTFSPREEAAPHAPLSEPSPSEENPGHPDPLMRLNSKHCRWPIGDPKAENFAFCCRPKANAETGPYCEEHTARARDKRPRKHRGRRDFRTGPAARRFLA